MDLPIYVLFPLHTNICFPGAKLINTSFFCLQFFFVYISKSKFHYDSKPQSFQAALFSRFASNAYSESSVGHLIKATFESLLYLLFNLALEDVLGIFDIVLPSQFCSVEPSGPTDKILHSLCTLQVKSLLNCLCMSKDPSSEWPERKLHS